MTSFTDLALPAALVRVLADQGIETPFPIQTATLPDSLTGRDVLGRGRTGSGKTLAFALPTVSRLAASGARRRPRRPRALVLCPTRELANQIDATMAPVAHALGLTTQTIFGGVSQAPQVAALEAGVDVVIACPGRLEDLLKQRVLTLDSIEITVLDEADHMADLGFLPGVKRIMDATPAGGQRMLFSATLDSGVDQLVKRYLSNPVRHSVDDDAAPPPQMTHHILAVQDADAKRQIVQQLASGTGRRVLFMRTKHQAKKLARQLTAAGIPAVDLQGNLGQNARERNLAAFSSGAVKVLVATDIAARGIHVDNIELVVHVDPPAEHKAYLHRSGRTARAGSEGAVVTVVLPEQRGDMRDLARKARITTRPTPTDPGDPTVTALVGEVATYVRPTPPAPAQAPARRPGSSRGPRRRSGTGQSDRSGGTAPRGTRPADDSTGRPARTPDGGSLKRGAQNGGSDRRRSTDSTSRPARRATENGGSRQGSSRRGGSRRSQRPAGAPTR